MQRHFSIWQNAVETFRGCQQDLNLAPARIIVQRLVSAWNLQRITRITAPHRTSDCLPSRKLSLEGGVLPESIEETYNLHWQNRLLMYMNDLNVYVWQPHLEQTPSVCYNSVTIIMPAKALISQSGGSSARRPPSCSRRSSEIDDEVFEHRGRSRQKQSNTTPVGHRSRNTASPCCVLQMDR